MYLLLNLPHCIVRLGSNQQPYYMCPKSIWSQLSNSCFSQVQLILINSGTMHVCVCVCVSESVGVDVGQHSCPLSLKISFSLVSELFELFKNFFMHLKNNTKASRLIGIKELINVKKQDGIITLKYLIF
uniref:Uncharacterized protein n=1 Tax=Micrurus carvalhoi TaxID=3147026 RepID=A0A2H6N0K1_9SAUR